MENVIVVEGTKLERIEYNGQPIISLPMIDRVHRRPKNTAQRTFFKFKNRLRFGKDYMDLPYEEWAPLTIRKTYSQRGSAYSQKAEKGGYRGSMIFLTLTGYLMLVKTFTDDLSWKVQQILVDSYFTASQCISDLQDELITTQRLLINALMKKRKGPVTYAERAEIIALKQQGLETAHIARRIDRSKTTVKDTVRKARQLMLFDLALPPAH
jgi:hypothetical protein